MNRSSFLHSVLCVAVAALAAAAQSTTTTLPVERVATHDGGALYRAGEHRILVLRGTPYEMGVQHGRLLAAEARIVLTEALAWTERNGLDEAGLKAIRDAYAPHLPKRYHEEMRGLADGARLPLDTVTLLHAMPERFHCSGAAAAGSATIDGKLYHSRSLDYALDVGVGDRIQNHAVLIVRIPEDGIAHAVPAWAGFVGGVTGINAAGISIGEKGSDSRDEAFTGFPMIFLVREALHAAKSLDAAIATFERGPRTCGYCYVIGSGDERLAACIESTRSQFFVSRSDDDAEAIPPHTRLVDAVRRTNHFVGKATAATQRDVYDPRVSRASSFELYEAITAFLTERHGKLDGPAFVELLRRYPPGHGCLHQAVMGATDRLLWLANAADDRKLPFAGAQNRDFVRYDLKAWFAGEPEPRVTVLPAAATTGAAPRDVVLRSGERRMAFVVDTAQASARFVVDRYRPATAGWPTVHLYRPTNATGAPAVLMFASGDPQQRVDKALAAMLAAHGVATLLVPIVGDGGADADATLVDDLAAARTFAADPEFATPLLAHAGCRGPLAVVGVAAGGAFARSVGDRWPLALLFHGAGAGAALWTSDRSASLFRLPADELQSGAKWLADHETELDAATDRPAPARTLFVGLRGERLLPEAPQQAMAERHPNAETLWLEGGIGRLPLRANEIAKRIAAFARAAPK